MTYTVLITGANRGIGLEFVKQYATDGWKVFAACRKPEKANELQSLIKEFPNISMLQLDVTNEAQIKSITTKLAGTPIDLLLLNAGIYGEKGNKLGNISASNMGDVFITNVVSPLKLTESLIDNVATSQLKHIAYISSKMGSIADNSSGGAYAYRASKAAGNIVMKSLSIDLAAKGIQVIMLHPGWVKTDMGGPDAQITTTDSVTGMRKVIANLDKAKNGKFYAYDGQEVLW